MSSTGVDYLALSGHKAYAPFGAGVLAGLVTGWTPHPRIWPEAARSVR